MTPFRPARAASVLRAAPVRWIAPPEDPGVLVLEQPAILPPALSFSEAPLVSLLSLVEPAAIAGRRRKHPGHRVPDRPRSLDAPFIRTALLQIARATKDPIGAVTHAYEIGRTLPHRLRRELSNARGFLCEALGQEKLSALFPEAAIDSGVELLQTLEGPTAGELDGIALRDSDGRVLALAEAKAGPARVRDGVKRLRTHLARIKSGEMEAYRLRDDPRHAIPFDAPGPYSRDRWMHLSPKNCLGISPKDGPNDPDIIKIDISSDTLSRIGELLVAEARAEKKQAALPRGPHLDLRAIEAGIEHALKP